MDDSLFELILKIKNNPSLIPSLTTKELETIAGIITNNNHRCKICGEIGEILFDDIYCENYECINHGKNIKGDICN